MGLSSKESSREEKEYLSEMQQYIDISLYCDTLDRNIVSTYIKTALIYQIYL